MTAAADRFTAVSVQTWPALGTNAVLCITGGSGHAARSAAQREIDEIDAAASRFRDDSELSLVPERRRSLWRAIELADGRPAVRVPAGLQLDLGATAKALTADRGARAAHLAGGAGALLSLGGDIATCGPAPPGGWSVHVTDDHRSAASAEGQTVAIASGGLATSSLVPRRWRHNGRAVHHVLDPRTGLPVAPVWRTASLAAATCAEANIASTAALVL